jgi:hypothetical protein
MANIANEIVERPGGPLVEQLLTDAADRARAADPDWLWEMLSRTGKLKLLYGNRYGELPPELVQIGVGQ